MTAKDTISKTLLQLNHQLITVDVAEKIIFPAINSIVSDAKAEAVVEYLVKKLMDTIEEGNVTMTNSLMAVRRCLDKLEAANG